MILTALKTGLTAIRANASGILLGIAFIGGATAGALGARIWYLTVIANKDYAKKILSIIEKHDLTKLDA